MENNSYVSIVGVYADGVRMLFAPSDQLTRERGRVQGPTSYEDLADKAEDLSAVSDNLGNVITAQLSAPDAILRMEGSTRILAKALTDLEVSAQLLQSAMDEEQKIQFEKSRGAERSVGDIGVTAEYLDILLGEGKAVSRAVERGARPASIPEARMTLSTSLDDTMTLIVDRASKTAQSAVSGLAGLGAGELVKAAGALGMSVVGMLGQAEKVSRLYALFRSFMSKVYDSLAALVGQSLIQKAGQKVLEWVNELNGGKYFPEILEALYQTKKTKEELKKFIDTSQVALGHFTSAIQTVDGLKMDYGTQVKLVEKLIKGLKFIGGLSEAVLPQSKLILAAAYIGLGGYVVLAGADYVDSPNIKWLNRVAGVHRVVVTELT
jgi:hypothetical protein